MSVQDIKQAPIELIIDQDDDGQVAANVPVRWKISPEMVHTLAEKGVEPYILLVVTANDTEMDRVLLPLRLGMTYLQMRRPGINTIHATIVWQRAGEESVRQVVMQKDDYGNYKFKAFRSYIPGKASLDADIERARSALGFAFGEEEINELGTSLNLLLAARDELIGDGYVFGLPDDYEAIERTPEGDQINVDVPEEMFAPPPSWLMKKLATLYTDRFWGRSGWRDQCDVRRRALFTVLTLPLVLVIGVPLAVAVASIVAVAWLIMKTAMVIVTGVLLFFGKRNLDYSVIYTWDDIEFKDIWRHSQPSFWTHKRVETEYTSWDGDVKRIKVSYQPRDSAFRWINPPVMLLYFAVFSLINLFVGDVFSVFGNMLRAIIVPVLIGLLSSGIDRWKIKSRADKSQSVGAVAAAVRVQERTKLERQLSSLTTSGAASVNALPKEQRTVRLRYLHLKASVCKPFAK